MSIDELEWWQLLIATIAILGIILLVMVVISRLAKQKFSWIFDVLQDSAGLEFRKFAGLISLFTAVIVGVFSLAAIMVVEVSFLFQILFSIETHHDLTTFIIGVAAVTLTLMCNMLFLHVIYRRPKR